MKRNELCQLMGLKSCRFGSDTRLIFSHLEEGEADWGAVAIRLESHPQEATDRIDTSAYGSVFPLTAALRNTRTPVPANVVDGFLRAHPKAMAVGSNYPLTDSPLDVAIENPETSVEVLKLLLSHAGPEMLLQDHSLHHFLYHGRFDGTDGLQLLQAFVDASPGSLNKECARRGLGQEYAIRPIEIALYFDAPLDIIRYLLEAGVKQDVGGKHGAAGLFTKRVLEDSDSDDSDAFSETTPKTVLRIAIELAIQGGMPNRWCNVLVECLKTAGSARGKLESRKDYPPIHIAIQSATPRVTMDLINHQGQDFHSGIDPLGRTALHASMIAAGRRLEGEYSNVLEIADWKVLVKHLINHDDGKAACIRDHDGNLPLHYAIESGLCNKIGLDTLVGAYPQAATCCNAVGEVPLHNAIKKGCLRRETGLECIMDACPRAAISRDVKTCMYPFMLAGSAPNSNVDTIYMMLREDPAAVQSGICPSPQELYLTRKHDEERTQWQKEKAEWQRREAELLKREAELEGKVTQYQTEISTLSEHLARRENEAGSKRKRDDC